MCQSRVYRLVKRSKKPLTIAEIARKLRLSPGPVQNSCKKMWKFGELDRIAEPRYGTSAYLYFVPRSPA